MSIAIPQEIRDRIRQKIWDKAGDLDWSKLTDIDRTKWYENWSKEKEIGGALAHFMDARKVRVYIKDSLLKPYLRQQLEHDSAKFLLATGLAPGSVTIKRNFDKPHGRLLSDGQIISWGNSRDWKSIVISVFERAYRIDGGIPYAAVFIESGKTANDGIRHMIEDVGHKLGLERVVWID